RRVVVGRQGLLRLRTSEPQHVTASFLLSGVFAKLALKHTRVRGVDDDQLFEIVGMGDRESPAFTGGYGDSRRMPSYSDLMTESDGVSRNWNFLATEDQFQAIQGMQKSNLIVPLVGDFAGPKAIRSVGQYVQEHASTVHAFYTSNVEQYL